MWKSPEAMNCAKTEDASAVAFYYKSIKPDKHNFPPFGKLLSM